MPSSVIDSCNTEYVPSVNNLFYKVPDVDGLKHIFDLTTKDIYAILLHNDVPNNKSTDYWKARFDVDSIDFNMWYKKLFVCKMMPRKVLDFNWRIFHGQIVTEKRLASMKLSDGKCTSCKLEVEDVTHIFVKCPTYKTVWEYVISILKNFDIPQLDEFNIIAGFLHEDALFDIVNTLLSMTRWIIWKRRCSSKFEKDYKETINIVFEFKYTMKKHFETVLQSNIISDRYTKGKINAFLRILTA